MNLAISQHSFLSVLATAPSTLSEEGIAFALYHSDFPLQDALTFQQCLQEQCVPSASADFLVQVLRRGQNVEDRREAQVIVNDIGHSGKLAYKVAAWRALLRGDPSTFAERLDRFIAEARDRGNLGLSRPSILGIPLFGSEVDDILATTEIGVLSTDEVEKGLEKAVHNSPPLTREIPPLRLWRGPISMWHFLWIKSHLKTADLYKSDHFLSDAAHHLAKATRHYARIGFFFMAGKALFEAGELEDRYSQAFDESQEAQRKRHEQLAKEAFQESARYFIQGDRNLHAAWALYRLGEFGEAGIQVQKAIQKAADHGDNTIMIDPEVARTLMRRGIWNTSSEGEKYHLLAEMQFSFASSLMQSGFYYLAALHFVDAAANAYRARRDDDQVFLALAMAADVARNQLDFPI